LTRRRNDSRCFDFDFGSILDERRHLHERHRGEMTADHAAVHLTHLGRSREVLPLVGDVPGEPHEILGLRLRFGEDLDDVLERLLDLRHEIVAGDFLPRIPADLAGDEDLAPFAGQVYLAIIAALMGPASGRPAAAKTTAWLQSRALTK
jgi:hypothetical protein